MNQESGRSMIEMIGVLAIMGALTGVAFVMITDATASQKQRETVDEVAIIVSKVQDLHRGFDDFSVMDGPRILNMMGKVKNPYGGSYDLMVDSSDSRRFIVSINGLDKSECEALSMYAWTDSVGYRLSDKKQSGATGSCDGANGTNVVQITFGE